MSDPTRLTVEQEALAYHVDDVHRQAGFGGGHGLADWSVCEHSLCVAARPFAALSTTPAPDVPEPAIVRACPECGAVGLADGPVTHRSTP